MIRSLTLEELPRVAPLFAAHTDSLVLSCLQGHMGSAYINADAADPFAGAQIITADFAFFAGRADAALAAHAPAAYRDGCLIVIQPSDEWAAMLRRVWPGRVERRTRYGFHRDPSGLEPHRLRQFRDALPAGYELRRFDGALYEQALPQRWSRDFVRSFDSREDFLRRGIGYGVLCTGELVAAASSYTVYDGGIEIEIGTREDHRRKGLARSAGAALILDCLEQGKYPCWDAANPISRHLAESLGYRFDRAYPADHIHITKEN